MTTSISATTAQFSSGPWRPVCDRSRSPRCCAPLLLRVVAWDQLLADPSDSIPVSPTEEKQPLTCIAAGPGAVAIRPRPGPHQCPQAIDTTGVSLFPQGMGGRNVRRLFHVFSSRSKRRPGTLVQADRGVHPAPRGPNSGASNRGARPSARDLPGGPRPTCAPRCPPRCGAHPSTVCAATWAPGRATSESVRPRRASSRPGAAQRPP
jgi:hypothetical protein